MGVNVPQGRSNQFASFECKRLNLHSAVGKYV